MLRSCILFFSFLPFLDIHILYTLNVPSIRFPFACLCLSFVATEIVLSLTLLHPCSICVCACMCFDPCHSILITRFYPPPSSPFSSSPTHSLLYMLFQFYKNTCGLCHMLFPLSILYFVWYFLFHLLIYAVCLISSIPDQPRLSSCFLTHTTLLSLLFSPTVRHSLLHRALLTVVATFSKSAEHTETITHLQLYLF